MLSPGQPPSTVAGIIFQQLTAFPEVWIKRPGAWAAHPGSVCSPGRSLLPAPLCHLEEGGAETGARRLLSSADTPIAGAAGWHLKPNKGAEARGVGLGAAAAPLCTEHPWLWGDSPPLETSPRNQVFREMLSPNSRSSSAWSSSHVAASARNVLGFFSLKKKIIQKHKIASIASIPCELWRCHLARCCPAAHVPGTATVSPDPSGCVFWTVSPRCPQPWLRRGAGEHGRCRRGSCWYFSGPTALPAGGWFCCRANQQES